MGKPIDDIIVHGTLIQDHLLTVHDVLWVQGEWGMKIKLAKCQFFQA